MVYTPTLPKNPSPTPQHMANFFFFFFGRATDSQETLVFLWRMKKLSFNYHQIPTLSVLLPGQINMSMCVSYCLAMPCVMPCAKTCQRMSTISSPT